jgi:hypothetical protein
LGRLASGDERQGVDLSNYGGDRHPGTEEIANMILHVTAAADWRAAQASGAYRLSTGDRTLPVVARSSPSIYDPRAWPWRTTWGADIICRKTPCENVGEVLVETV